MRIRGIDTGYDELHEADPDMGLTRTAFRRLVISGAIPSTRIGVKYLVDLDVVETFLRGSVPAPATAPGIREVKL